MAYLDDHPCAVPQFRDPRRGKEQGVIVVHTAESVMDTVGPDTGAEAVADWITRRTDPGSYHDLVDSDSYMNLVRDECEAFHDGTGSNKWSWSVSFACSYLDWAKMPVAKRDLFVTQGAGRAAAYAKRLQARTGIVIPALRITKAQSDAGQRGFISHAERDPARRKDPGNDANQFPWVQFLNLYSGFMAPAPTPIPWEDDVSAAVKGNQSVKVYATDGITKRHIATGDQMNQLALTGAVRTDNGQPFVVDQATIDAIPEV